MTKLRHTQVIVTKIVYFHPLLIIWILSHTCSMFQWHMPILFTFPRINDEGKVLWGKYYDCHYKKFGSFLLKSSGKKSSTLILIWHFTKKNITSINVCAQMFSHHHHRLIMRQIHFIDMEIMKVECHNNKKIF